MAVLAGTDFFTVEVLTWRGLVTYYVLFFLHLETRRVTLAGITRHPTEAWMTQMARNAVDETSGYLRQHRGGSTGFLKRSYQGGRPVYRVDTGVLKLLGQLRAVDRRAAAEVADSPAHCECRQSNGPETEEEVCLALWADVAAKRREGNESAECSEESQAPHDLCLPANCARPYGGILRGLGGIIT